MLAKGWIKPSLLPYGAPTLLVSKKTRELRIFIDFRSLNANSKIDCSPQPTIADLVNKLGKAKNYSSIILSSAYH